MKHTREKDYKFDIKIKNHIKSSEQQSGKSQTWRRYLHILNWERISIKHMKKMFTNLSEK